MVIKQHQIDNEYDVQDRHRIDICLLPQLSCIAAAAWIAPYILDA